MFVRMLCVCDRKCVHARARWCARACVRGSSRGARGRPLSLTHTHTHKHTHTSRLLLSGKTSFWRFDHTPLLFQALDELLPAAAAELLQGAGQTTGQTAGQMAGQSVSPAEVGAFLHWFWLALTDPAPARPTPDESLAAHRAAQSPPSCNDRALHRRGPGSQTRPDPGPRPAGKKRGFGR